MGLEKWPGSVTKYAHPVRNVLWWIGDGGRHAHRDLCNRQQTVSPRAVQGYRLAVVGEPREQLRDGVARALAGDLKACCLVPPKQPEVVVRYKDQAMAYRKSFYPGAELVAPTQVRLQTASMFEVMRFLMFAT